MKKESLENMAYIIPEGEIVMIKEERRKFLDETFKKAKEKFKDNLGEYQVLFIDCPIAHFKVDEKVITEIINRLTKTYNQDLVGNSFVMQQDPYFARYTLTFKSKNLSVKKQ